MWTYELACPGKFNQIELPTLASSDLAEGDVLLRVLVGGVCGSDLPHFWGKPGPFTLEPSPDGRIRTSPGSPMHEVVGEVVSSRDDTLKVGALVVGWATRLNGLSEYIVVKGGDVHAFDPELSPSVAIMLQPLACVLFAVDSFRNVQGSIAAVIGQGPIGVLFSHVLKNQGAVKVVGIDRVDRSDVAATFGVDVPVRSTSNAWASVTEAASEKPNIIVEAVGHQVATLVDATRAIQNDGEIYYFGIPDDPIYPFPLSAFQRKNATLIAGVTPFAVRRGVLARAEAYLKEHPSIAEPYISRRYKFSEVEAAFTEAITPSVGRLKVTLEV
jgi:L-iditol 2-dehydrogenase